MRLARGLKQHLQGVLRPSCPVCWRGMASLCQGYSTTRYPLHIANTLAKEGNVSSRGNIAWPASSSQALSMTLLSKQLAYSIDKQIKRVLSEIDVVVVVVVVETLVNQDTIQEVKPRTSKTASILDTGYALTESIGIVNMGVEDGEMPFDPEYNVRYRLSIPGTVTTVVLSAQSPRPGDKSCEVGQKFPGSSFYLMMFLVSTTFTILVSINHYI